ncbi:MAG: ABC transporter ATP-binding protein [Spirochaetales bacterium]|jgi:oligopeptide/dipeptide ABC transporter ATP-binding protein|nr:ABC transporter ATP-binding protein [Spirochaetales bacterium]
MGQKNDVLEVRDLRTQFNLREGVLKAVDGVEFTVGSGEVVGIVGESGCGKSITVRSILRMIRKPGESSGSVLFRASDSEPVDLMTLSSRGTEIREIRGKKINMIFQEPMNALSPVHTVGSQIIEAIMLHTELDKHAAREKTIELLQSVGISEPNKRVDAYPFQLSGGMRQRAMIAMAISCDPELLIADEPTTALDVSVQAQILRLLKDLQQRLNMAMIFITHDLAVIAQMADRIIVMYLGQIVEEATAEELFENPVHPYTRRLLQSILDPSDRRNKEEISTIAGTVPEPIDLPARCYFADRCEEGEDCVAKGLPSITEVGPGHLVRCYHASPVRVAE